MKINTDSDFYGSEENYIRSSSIKAFESCSFLYYANYKLKLPQEAGNDGARMGNVCHSVFECFLKPNRSRKLYNAVIKNGSIAYIKPITKLTKKLIKNNNLPNTQEVFEKIDKMICCGLSTDFFVEGEQIIGAEYRFKYKNEFPKYFIIGTMDKIALQGDNVIITDFKSSKSKYKGSDREFNLQAFLYSLYAKKTWPDKKPIVRFIFLQFPANPVMEISYNDNQILGFEHYLAQTQLQMDNFTEQDSLERLAAHQGMPVDSSFSGRLLCGFAKSSTELKKDGTPKWACACKFKRDYYVLLENEKIINSSYNPKELTPNDKQVVEKRIFGGCPAYNHADKFI